MKKIINFFISKIKGQEFNLDKDISSSYLLGFIVRLAISFIYAIILFRRRKIAFVHRTAIIRNKRKFRYSNNLHIDRNCYIDALSTQGINLGQNVMIGKNTNIECTGNLRSIGFGLVVGDNSSLGSHGFFGSAGGITIGENTILGNYVSLHSENHIYTDINTPIKQQGVTHLGIRIGDNCWIGAKVTILDGTNIGNGTIVAAGAVVTKGDYPPNCILGGVPARILKYRI